MKAITTTKPKVFIVVLILIIATPKAQAQIIDLDRLSWVGWGGVGMMGGGALSLGIGLVLSMTEDPNQNPALGFRTSEFAYLFGGVFAGSGLILFLTDIFISHVVVGSSNNPSQIYLVSADTDTDGEQIGQQVYYKRRENNPLVNILRHTVVGVSPNSFYLGYSWRF